jgi:beta-aspartyl-dipeptidase (metallo-type)
MAWTLIRGGHLFDPEDRGIADLLLIDDRVAVVGPALAAPTGIGEGQVVDVEDRLILPGFIDGHIHVMGASGPGGPTTRTTDLQIERIVAAGVTTVVSPLGADSLSRSIPALLARAAALDAEGITALCYTGGWTNPVPTLTGDPQADVAYLDRVVGVKVSVAEPMAPAYTLEELCRLAHAAFMGGRLAGKGAVLHTHIGDRPEGLSPLLEVHRRTGIPLARLVATHVNRNPSLWPQAMEFARAGGSIDLTGTQRAEAGHPQAIAPAQALAQALAAGLPPARLTLSTDSGAAARRLDEADGRAQQYMSAPDSLLQTLRELITLNLSWGQAVRFCTAHVADLLGLARKGYLTPGRDADVLILTPSGEVDRVYARGRLLVDRGTPLVRGPFGAAPYA